MAEIGHLLVVDPPQGIEAAAILLQLGQGRVAQPLRSGQPDLIAPVEIGVDADQLSEVAFLAPQLLLQGG